MYYHIEVHYQAKAGGFRDSLEFCLFILLAFLFFNILNRNRNSTIETFNADAATKEEITDELVIALFIEDITKAVTNYYSEYYSGEIAVYDYETAIVDIGKKEPGFISVKSGVASQVGAYKNEKPVYFSPRSITLAVNMPSP